MPAKTKARPKGRSKSTAKKAAPEKPQIYCMKCKTRTGSDQVAAVTMKNGRPAVESVCEVCGTKKFRIGTLQ